MLPDHGLVGYYRPVSNHQEMQEFLLTASPLAFRNIRGN